jgi:hypothetical protein
MTTRLQLYNGALQIIGEREIVTLAEDREPRRSLDQSWNDGAIRYCLERAQWKFAMRATRVDHDTSVAPEWGFQYGFLKGDDWVSTAGVCQDEYFKVPLVQYEDEIGYWWADIDPIYVRYVSSATQYGGDLSRWPATFTNYVKAYLASQIVAKTQGASEGKINQVMAIAREALKVAKNKDAQGGPPRFAAQGSWVRSRQGGSRNRGPLGDGGSSSNLIG